MNYLQKEEDTITKACETYIDFHIATLRKLIIHKDTGEAYYKPSFFHDFPPSDKKKLLKNEHVDYKLIQKY